MLVLVNQRVEQPFAWGERGGNIGVDVYVADVVFVQHAVAFLAFGILWDADNQQDAHFFVVVGGVDEEVDHLVVGIVVSLVFQVVDYALLFLGQEVLVIVVAHFQQRLLFPLLQEGVDVLLAAAENHLVDGLSARSHHFVGDIHKGVAPVVGVHRYGGVEAAFGLEQRVQLSRRLYGRPAVIDDGGLAHLVPQFAPKRTVVGIGYAVDHPFQRQEGYLAVGLLQVVL